MMFVWECNVNKLVFIMLKVVHYKKVHIIIITFRSIVEFLFLQLIFKKSTRM